MIQALVRLLASAALSGAVMYGEDITIPFEGGSILVQNTFYTRYDSLLDLTRFQVRFNVINNTPDGWDLKLKFDGSVQCGGQGKVLSLTERVSLRQGALKTVARSEEQVQGKDGGCVLQKFSASILTAENKKLRINVATGERIDLEKQRELDAQAQAKQDAIEEIRQRRIAAEQKQKNAALMRKLRDNCTTTYQNTVEKKVKDLTVGEEQQVRACQALGLYPPR